MFLCNRYKYFFKCNTVICSIKAQSYACGTKVKYRKRPNKRPGRLLGCPVAEEGEGAFNKTI